MAAPLVDFPGDIVEFWNDEWVLGPESDGLEPYFIKWYRFAVPGQVDGPSDTP